MNIEGHNAARSQWIFSRKGVQRGIPTYIRETTVMTEVDLAFSYRSFMHVSEVNTPPWTLILWALMDFYITHGFISFAKGKLQNNCLYLLNMFLSCKLFYFYLITFFISFYHLSRKIPIIFCNIIEEIFEAESTLSVT